MGKHAKPAEQRGRATPGSAVRARPLPIKSTVRLRRPVDIWHKPALSAVAALAIPDLTLFALGRLDLILYTSAGAMCALYAHGLPYAARARTLPWVVLGMVASLGNALTAASLTTSTALLVVLASLIAAVHKMLCDATRIGPPGNLILTFITASAFFVPQRLGEVPQHVALALGTGVLAWLVCMAPSLVRPQGPERIATARALEAAAGLLRTESGAGGVESAGVAHARHATAAAVNAAWHTLFLVPARTPAKAAARARLERLLIRAESALGSGENGGSTGPHGNQVTADGYDDRYGRSSANANANANANAKPNPTAAPTATEVDRLAAWARDVRSGRPLPEVGLSAAQAEELRGVEATELLGIGADERVGVDAEAPGLRRPAPGRPRGIRAVLARLAPGSALLPIGARVAVGCLLAGWASMAVGVGHPYWAVVTAASIYQANTTLSWQRALQRTIGNLLGLLLFTALLPLIHTGQLAMIALALAFQLGAEACITRNYWLGSVWVTPMALLLTEFGGHLPAETLIADRWIDTVVGAAVGLACCVLVTNRRATDRIDTALARVAEAEAAALRLLAAGPVPGADDALETGWARDRLAGCLVELREAVEVAAGEWWQRALPEERIAHAEQQGHRALAGLVRRLSAPALAA
ncbi:FUSC family protein [Streptomyces inhibens]|uniref:FUSC family protein n=1 Tax=Streptomyces inhibens TaxID=2293571 RepID=UPI001EE73EE0|nr:FUSC family protein [Streptomyces inhibens]UKY53756.1 FUSC family protein [Streptomyces inhibens]